MRMDLKRRAHLVTTLALTVVIGGGLFYIGYSSTWVKSSSAGLANTSVSKRKAPVSDRAVIAMVGVGPSELAAAGVPASSLAAVLADTRQYIADKRDSLASADATVQSAKSSVDAARAGVKAGTSTTADLASAQAALDTATAARQAVLNGIFDHLCGQISSDSCSALTAIRHNRSRGLPLQYLVVDRTDSEWVSLREALADARIATSAGKVMSDGAYAIISNADGNSAVQSAKSSLDNTLSAVKQAFDQAFAS